MSKLILNGDLIFESLFLFRDREHQVPIQNWQILSGTLTVFRKGVTVVTLLQAIENLPEPFKVVGKDKIEDVVPSKISWLIYGQFRYSQAQEITISDLSMSLCYDELLKKPIPWIQITFPKREITNNSNFAVKVTLTKSMEFLAWNWAVHLIAITNELHGIVESDSDFTHFMDKLSEKEIRAWNTTLPEIRFFHMKICGCAREMR